VKYEDFLASKAAAAPTCGHRIEPDEVHPFLHSFQRNIVTWAVEKGRAAIWTTTGTGKTIMQLEYARLSGKTALIVAPLAVCQQTVREARKIDLDARYVRHGDQIAGPGVWVTNYEMVERFDPHALDVAVLDEGSILRDSTGKTRTLLIDHFKPVHRRHRHTGAERLRRTHESGRFRRGCVPH
jgi:superfamily II DNA or RNA helicase